MKTQTLTELMKEANKKFGNVYSSVAGAKIGEELRVTARCSIEFEAFIKKVYEAGRNEMIGEIENMAIDQVGNSAKTVEQILSILKKENK
jgi:hypothetical protein